MAEDLEPLLYWVRERDSVRRKKEAGLLPPWTEDGVLAKFRFTNVRRRDDRVSRWLRKYVLTQDNLENAGIDSFLMFTALCRWINWPPTIAEVMRVGLWPQETPDWKSIAELMEERGKTDKVWTGAYMVKAAREWKGRPKPQFVISEPIMIGVGKALDQIKLALTLNLKSAVWGVLVTQKYWGPFMAGQAVDDLTWTPLLADAGDHFTWAPQGPGSLRGFNRLKGLPLKTRYSMEEWCETLQLWRSMVISELGKEFADITLMDLQNCLCETDKYLRVKNGEGRPRSMYRPETAY